MDPIAKLIEKHRTTAAIVHRIDASECSPNGFAGGFYRQFANAKEYAAEELESAWRGSFGWAMAELAQAPGAKVRRKSWDACRSSIVMEHGSVEEEREPRRYHVTREDIVATDWESHHD